MPRVDQDSFYRNALARWGANAEGVHWHSREAQQVRFAALHQLLPGDLGRLTLVDVGCGLGDLHGFLAARDALPRRYTGIDLVAPMVELAQARTGCRILCRDALCDPLPTADLYVASGAMTLLTREETRRFIERCLAVARRGLVFNLLKGSRDSGCFGYWLPEEVVAIGAALGAPTEVLEGYLPGDFSVRMSCPERPRRRR